MKRLKTNVLGEDTWNDVASYLPQTHYGLFQRTQPHTCGVPVNQLAYYGSDGRLEGFLIHYPESFYGVCTKNDVMLMVRPDCRRKGMGTMLLKKGYTRFGITDLKSQTYTPLGHKFITGYKKKYPEKYER